MKKITRSAEVQRRLAAASNRDLGARTATAAPDMRGRALAGTFWAYMQNWGARGFSLLVFVALGRLLSPHDFGAMAIVMVLLTLSEVIVEQGFSHAIVQRPTLDAAHLSTAFWATLAVGITFAIVTWWLAGPLMAAYGQADLAPVVKALGPLFVLMALSSVPAALLRRELHYKALAKRAALSGAVSGCVAVYLAVSGQGVWTFVGQQLSYHLVGVVVLWRYESWRPRSRVSLSHLTELGSFSAQITLVRLLDLLETRVVDLIAGAVLGLVALGRYALAARASQAITQIVAAPLWESALSTFARLQQDSAAVRGAYLLMFEFSSIIAVPAFLLCATAAPQLIPAVFGPQWIPSVPAFQLLGLVAAVRTVTALNASFIQAVGLANTALKLAATRIAVSLLLLWALLPFGIEGIAGAVLCGQLCLLPVTVLIVRTRLQISWRTLAAIALKPLLLALVACLCTAVVGTALMRSATHVAAPLLGMAIGSVVYAVLVAIAMPGKLSLIPLGISPAAVQKLAVTLRCLARCRARAAAYWK